MAGMIVVIPEKEADPPYPSEETVGFCSWLCAAPPTLQRAGKVMTLDAAWGIRRVGGITGPLHRTGRPGTFLDLLSP